MNFQDELAKRTEETEKVIRSFLPAEAGFAGTMAQAMNYSMLAGGKRLRPMLIRETYRLFDGKEEVVKPFMAGMEMIHTHSLIHDDLPALDDDDYRRGRLTTHKVYGEAMGVLSGVALLNYAYETMFQAFALTKEQDRVIHALRVVSQKTGIHGMLGGQSVDVENDGKPLEKEMLDYIYRNKTSALIEASYNPHSLVQQIVEPGNIFKAGAHYAGQKQQRCQHRHVGCSQQIAQGLTLGFIAQHTHAVVQNTD